MLALRLGMWPQAKERWQLGETGSRFLPEALEEAQPCRHLDFSPFWTSGLQNCERISFCCFKPRGLRCSIPAAPLLLDAPVTEADPSFASPIPSPTAWLSENLTVRCRVPPKGAHFGARRVCCRQLF